MKVSSKLINSANGIISATISKAVIDAKKKQMAEKIAKTTKVDGFRKGKVPVQVIVSRYGAQITQDSQNEIIREAYEIGIKEFGTAQVLGNPNFEKFEEKDDSLEFEMKVSLRPAMKITDYDKLIPDYTVEEPTEDEIKEAIEKAAKAIAVPTKLKKKRALKEGDIAIIDFEGFVDGKSLENAAAKNFSLEIGSNRLIDGFEAGMVGMKYDETKELNLKFPEGYHATDLAGKDVKFVITLHEIQERVPVELTDDFARQLIPNDETMTLLKLKDVVKETLKAEKKSKLFNEELKVKLLEALVNAFDFELPELIVEEEINAIINNRLRALPEEELKVYQNSKEKIEELKKEVEPEAKERVKTTLIIDELAKQEKITITDQEVS
ncbi:MAG: trigger factor, partial [Campylobacterota bacterium]|nr:trigger factor [Campylobacterota bacterium]